MRVVVFNNAALDENTIKQEHFNTKDSAQA